MAESRPWYTKSGRLEFYRDEDEFIDAGENLPVHREPIDSTFYEPNVIVAPPHPFIRPKGPEAYGVATDDLSCEVRQGRNVVKPWAEAKNTAHPLAKDGYQFIFHTPKYRHGAHTMPIDIDMIAILFGPFGDIYRHDKRHAVRRPRATWTSTPRTRKALGVEDGDYVWIDSDPSDRPFRGWQKNEQGSRSSRACSAAPATTRARRAASRACGSTCTARRPARYEGTADAADGLAKNPRTGYQAMFRSGSHQSATRGWLKPTLDDRLARAQGRCSARRSARASCPTSTARPARRASRS